MSTISTVEVNSMAKNRNKNNQVEEFAQEQDFEQTRQDQQNKKQQPNKQNNNNNNK